jgi:quercetin dioxygenase-like cupin family protein
MTTEVNDNVIQVDRGTLEAMAKGERFTQHFLDRHSGGKHCEIAVIRTPPGEGSPSGYHIHDFDQFMYILSGVLTFEIEGETFTAGPDTFVIHRAGVPHLNRNDSDEATLHLAFNEPTPTPGTARAKPWPVDPSRFIWREKGGGAAG